MAGDIDIDSEALLSLLQQMQKCLPHVKDSRLTVCLGRMDKFAAKRVAKALRTKLLDVVKHVPSTWSSESMSAVNSFTEVLRQSLPEPPGAIWIAESHDFDTLVPIFKNYGTMLAQQFPQFAHNRQATRQSRW